MIGFIQNNNKRFHSAWLVNARMNCDVELQILIDDQKSSDRCLIQLTIEEAKAFKKQVDQAIFEIEKHHQKPIAPEVANT